jgi:PBP1b-binding outer membrane lipoprotein LpoB
MKMKLRIALIAGICCIISGCSKKIAGEKRAEDPAAVSVAAESEKTEYVIETSAEIVEIDKLPYLSQDKISLAFFCICQFFP